MKSVTRYLESHLFVMRIFTGRVADDNYVVSPESVDEFKERGYTVLSDFLSENEVKTLEETCEYDNLCVQFDY